MCFSRHIKIGISVTCIIFLCRKKTKETCFIFSTFRSQVASSHVFQSWLMNGLSINGFSAKRHSQAICRLIQLVWVSLLFIRRHFLIIFICIGIFPLRQRRCKHDAQNYCLLQLRPPYLSHLAGETLHIQEKGGRKTRESKTAQELTQNFAVTNHRGLCVKLCKF